MNKIIIALVVVIVILLGLIFLGSNISLESQTLLNGKITILVPTNFQQMTEDKLNEESSNNKPLVGYSDSSGSAKLLIKKLKSKIPQEGLSTVLPVYRSMFTKIDPSGTWYDDQLRTINGRKFISLEFDGTKGYNMFAMTTFEGRMLLIGFTCDSSDKGKYQKAAQAMRESIQIK